jgi:hypothetical protein
LSLKESSKIKEGEVSEAENIFPPKYFPAKILSRQNTFPPKYFPTKKLQNCGVEKVT